MYRFCTAIKETFLELYGFVFAIFALLIMLINAIFEDPVPFIFVGLFIYALFSAPTYEPLMF